MVLSLLFEVWPSKVLYYLVSQRKSHRVSKSQSIDDFYRYISTNEEQIRYDVFLINGYQIGSGASYFAFKRVFFKLFQQSVMIFTLLFSSSFLSFLLFCLNVRW